MKRTLIQNAVVINEGRKVLGSVVIENEKIAEILVGEENATAPCDEIIDATGCYLLPGAIDEHVHFRDPGLTHKADITTESRAAAAGGVTSIMDSPIPIRKLPHWRLWRKNLFCWVKSQQSTIPAISEQRIITIPSLHNWINTGFVE